MNRREFLSCSASMMALAGVAPDVFAGNPMAESNQRRTLSFSNEWIESTLVSAVRDLQVEDAIIVNVSAAPLVYKSGGDRWTMAPWKSSALRQCSIESAERVALLHVKPRANFGAVALTWDWYGKRNAQFPRTTPLYISSQDDIADVEFDPAAVFFNQPVSSPRRYRLKLNLWYTPEETDCGIHTGHQFLEVHTQVAGTGHMQKFRDNNATTIYEDVTMSPGFTHDPFFTLRNDRSFSYPWHRYYADTDCIWMAVELHPA